MRPKLIPVLIFLLVAVMAVPLVMSLGSRKQIDPVKVTDLDVGAGRVFRITVETNFQQTLSLHYHVDIDGQPQIEHAFFGTLPRTSPPPDFVIYADGSGDLVGLAQVTVPDRIVIIHDFATGESWPMRKVNYKDNDPQHIYPYYEEKDSIVARGEAMFARLDQALPDQELKLLRTMGTRPLTVPDGRTNATPPVEADGYGNQAPIDKAEDHPGE